MKNTALLLTQYERFGSVGTDEYIENYINEELEVTIDMISEYNRYLIKNGDDPYYDDLDVMLSGFDPVEIARMTFYGNFHFAYDFHQFNGYGNIDSFEEYQVVDKMKDDRNFLRWYIEQYEIVDLESDEVQEVIDLANELIRKGF